MKIQTITSRNFRRYGKVIEYPSKKSKGDKRNLWRIVHTQKNAAGWRIAYLVLRDKSIGRMEMHPNSDESFEPVKGRALFFISKDKRLESVECFYLDQPVIVYKGIWHGLISLDSEVEIKITENAQVRCQYWSFGFRVYDYLDVRKRVGL